MTSYHCQICTMDMSVARIRTPEDPPDAAWSYRGCNYVGFDTFQDLYGRKFPDQQCEQCTTLDRTPATLNDDIKSAVSGGPLWPEDDVNDSDWLPEDDVDMESEPLEYDTEADSDAESSEMPECDEHVADGHDTDARMRSALFELHTPRMPAHLPHGTLRNGYMYTKENWRPEFLGSILQKQTCGSYRMPLEHIAAPSCQSLQGINGHVLSAEEIKSCRNHRFLLAKPLHWQAEDSDSIFEDGSLFVLSGESNGSYVSHVAPYVYPPRYGIDKVPCWNLYINGGCNESDQWQPLPVHSYCLDIFAKVSYRRYRRVDLDAIWHWREMQSQPDSYELTEEDVQPCPEIARGRQNKDGPWCHQPGDEWLTANPVEVPGSCTLMESCRTSFASDSASQHPRAHFLGLPNELIDHVMSFLKEKELMAMADTCRKLRYHAKLCFKALAVQNLGWLWEVFEAEQYPTSPDWPVTWDPCNPPGLVVPDLPPGLRTEEDENAVWAQITGDYPEMHDVGETVKAINSLRREAVLGPYLAKARQSHQDWNEFRSGVAQWIRRLPSDVDRRTRDLDWVRLWRLFNSDSISIPGIRNRARIWKDCERILDYNINLREQCGIDAKTEVVREVISYNREQWWDQAMTQKHDRFHNGFLRRAWQDD